MNKSTPVPERDRRAVTIELDEFGWMSLREEAARQKVTLEQLIEHAAMYYLADIHSGRAAVQVFRRAVGADAPGRPSPSPGSVRRFGSQTERRDDDDD